MAALKYIREIKDTRLLLLGIIGEGEPARYTVSTTVMDSIGNPSVGADLDDRQMSVIIYADKLYRAKKKALSILAYADNNSRSLSMKLARAGFDREIVGEVVDEMISLGYIREKDQLERLILVEANQKLRGPARIIPALAAKGYSSSDVREVMHRLVDEREIDFKKNARLLVEKKLPDLTDVEEKKKLLYKNGFKI